MKFIFSNKYFFNHFKVDINKTKKTTLEISKVNGFVDKTPKVEMIIRDNESNRFTLTTNVKQFQIMLDEMIQFETFNLDRNANSKNARTTATEIGNA